MVEGGSLDVTVAFSPNRTEQTKPLTFLQSYHSSLPQPQQIRVFLVQHAFRLLQCGETHLPASAPFAPQRGLLFSLRNTVAIRPFEDVSTPTLYAIQYVG